MKSVPPTMVESLIVTAIILLFILVMTVIGWTWNAQVCSSRFSGVGVTSWGPMQGCQVTLPDGRRMPAEMLRSVDP